MPRRVVGRDRAERARAARRGNRTARWRCRDRARDRAGGDRARRSRAGCSSRSRSPPCRAAASRAPRRSTCRARQRHRRAARGHGHDRARATSSTSSCGRRTGSTSTTSRSTGSAAPRRGHGRGGPARRAVLGRRHRGLGVLDASRARAPSSTPRSSSLRTARSRAGTRRCAPCRSASTCRSAGCSRRSARRSTRCRTTPSPVSDPAVNVLPDGTRLGVMISWEVFFGGRGRAATTADGTGDTSILINPTNGASYTGTVLQTPAGRVEQAAGGRERALGGAGLPHRLLGVRRRRTATCTSAPTSASRR